MFKQKNIKILFTTTEWDEAPFIKDQILKIIDSGISADVYKIKGKKKLINYIFDRLKLGRKIKKEKYDIIHAHYGQSGVISKFRNIPLVTTFHGSDSIGLIGKNGKYSIKGKILKFISFISSKLSQKNIFVSEKAKISLNALENSIVIPCGIDTSNFKPLNKNNCRQKFGFEDKKYILFAGNPDVAVKNYELAEKSYEVLKSFTDFSCEMIPLKGYKHIEVPMILNSIDVLLMTSFHEGSPMIIKEALACNTPVVSVDVGDVKEIIRDVDGCYIVKNRQPKDIALLIEKVFKNKNKLNSRGSIKNLDLEIINNKILNVYNDIIVNKKSYFK